MIDFLKSLTDKFLDFFNIGRAISILLPGALVAFILLMLLSLAVFPSSGVIAATPPKKEVAAPEKVTTIPAATGKDKKDKKDKKFKNSTTHQAGEASVPAAKKPEKVSANSQTNLKAPEPLRPLSAQVADDFLRVTRHYWVVLLMALVIGILLYEVGNVIIAFWSKGSGHQLYRYKEGKDVNDKILVTDDGNKKAVVGFIYFAPLLKSDFTGKENYYNFLITEYYRFLEFSAVMPIAMLAASFLAGLYYFGACHVTKASCHIGVIFAAIVLVLIAIVLFYWIVFRKVLEGYRKASADLIKGVTDATNKGIIK